MDQFYPGITSPDPTQQEAKRFFHSLSARLMQIFWAAIAGFATKPPRFRVFGYLGIDLPVEKLRHNGSSAPKSDARKACTKAKIESKVFNRKSASVELRTRD